MSHLRDSLGEGGYVQLAPFRHGNAHLFLCLKKDSYIGGAVRDFGEYSEGEVDVFRRFVRPSDFVIDAGALFGEHTLALAGLCPRGVVFAFEPQRIPFQILCANLQLNSISNAEASLTALSDVTGIGCVPSLDPREADDWGLSKLTFSGQFSQWDAVGVQTIDSFTLPHLDFLKIDVEGHELPILLAGEKTIASYRPVIYLEFNRNRRLLLKLLQSWNYFTFRHLVPVNRYPNYAGKPLRPGVDDTRALSDMVLAVPESRLPGWEWLAINHFEEVK